MVKKLLINSNSKDKDKVLSIKKMNISYKQLADYLINLYGIDEDEASDYLAKLSSYNFDTECTDEEKEALISQITGSYKIIKKKLHNYMGALDRVRFI